MLQWAVVFLVVAIIAAIFGFGGIVGPAVAIAKVLFFLFLVLFVVSLLLGRTRTPVV
jgi:uncharacterized membrane protein YtjA (UPF0391 family)